jgi:hypothetical protein
MTTTTSDSGSHDIAELAGPRERMHNIAKAEIDRHRNRLSELSEEQQSVVEGLLVSTANRISQQIGDRLQRYPDPIRLKYLTLWASLLGG